MANTIDILWRNLPKYLDHLRGERRLAANTIESYAADIKSFISFLEEPATLGDVLPLSKATIRAYSARLGSSRHIKLESSLPPKLAASSQERRLIGLKGYLRFLYRRGVIRDDLSRYIDLPRKPKHLPVHLSRREMELVLDTATGDDFLAVRNLAIIEVIYATGCRVSEIAGLDINTIDLPACSARVRGKGSKERVVVFGQFAQRALRRWLSTRTGTAKHDEAALFVNKRGGRLNVRSIQRLVKHAGLLAGLPAGITPHALRHSFATHMLSGGADLRTIQELLGHSSMSTVQKYTHLDIEKIKQVHSKTHPLGDG